jgi:hypothetical protein
MQANQATLATALLHSGLIPHQVASAQGFDLSVNRSLKPLGG